jgi:NADH:ubiquinone oxidoreductase subunit H
VHALDFLRYTPIAATAAIGAFCFLGAVRERRAPEKIGMAGLGIVLFLLAALFAYPPVLTWVQGLFWFTFKVGLVVYGFIWVRFTFPRYRYDQLMNVGWRWLIPIAIANVIVTGFVMVLK